MILSVLKVRQSSSIVKPAERAEWGGWTGHFADPDGHLWKVGASGATHLFSDQ